MTSSPGGVESEALRAFEALVDLSPAARIHAVERLATERPDLATQLRLLEGRFDHTRALLDDLSHAAFAAGERYEVRGAIDSGGMGTVLRVFDRHLQRELAMKTVRHGNEATDDPAWRRRQAKLRNEAVLLGQLAHPSIVPLHDVGENEQGEMFFTMQLVQGEHLGAIIARVHARDPEWNLSRLVGVLQRVCEAVAYAHSTGVLHRDLKPSNVMVGRFGETYVLDWGLAKRMQLPGPEIGDAAAVTEALSQDVADGRTPSDELILQTLAGDVLGTPAYMAPEQAEGRVDAIDERSDVYAIGALLYHALANRHPYADTTGASPPDLVQAVRTRPPTPLRRLVRRGPEELVAIAERAMARAPEDRYQSMQEMADELRRHLELRVVRAHRTGPVAELRKWTVRNKGFAASLLVGVLALVGLLFVEVDAGREQSKRADDLRRRAYFQDVTVAALSLERGDIDELNRRLANCPADLRGWEWRCLDALADTSERTLVGHGSAVEAMSASRDGRRLATSDETEVVRLWDANTGACLYASKAIGRNALAFDAEGKRLFVAGSDLVLDADTGAVLRKAPWSVGKWPVLALSPDGSTLARGSSASSMIELWDARTLEPLGQLEGNERPTKSMAWSADGVFLFVGGRDSESDADRSSRVRVFDVAARKKVRELAGHGNWVSAVAPSPDTHWLASGGWDGTVRLWDLTGRSPMRELAKYAGTAVVAFSSDGSRLVTSGSHLVEVWSTETWTVVERLVGHRGQVFCMQFQGDRLCTAGGDRVIKSWRLGRPLRITEAATDGPTYWIAPCPGSDQVAIASLGSTRIWNAAERRIRNTARIDVRRPFLSWAPDGSRLFVADYEGGLGVYDPETLTQLDARSLPSKASGIDVHPGGALVVTGEEEMIVRAWRWDGHNLHEAWATMAGVFVWPQGVRPRFSPDGSLIAVGSNDGRLRLLEPGTGSIRRELRADTANVVYGPPVFSPNGAFVAANVWSGPDPVLMALWDVASGKLRWQVEISQGPSQPCAFTHDGSRILWGSPDGGLVVADASTGTRIATLPGPSPAAANAIAVTDDDTVILGTQSGLVRFWSARPQ